MTFDTDALKGSGIAPFFPISSLPSGLYLPFHVFLFLVRLPILLTVTLSYFFVLQWLPIGSLGKKASLWLMLGVPGVWWIDLQIDGVKKGSVSVCETSTTSADSSHFSSLAQQHKARLPQPGSVIASSYTSPIDSLYLAAIFDPVFTASYPSTRLVQPITLFNALLRAFQKPQYDPPATAKLTELKTLLRQYPNQAIVVFPECTTTNGRGILRFSSSLLSVPSITKIFPTSLRYTDADITTPVPGGYIAFCWNLLSKPTHCIRVRIAESVYNNSQLLAITPSNNLDVTQYDTASSSDTLIGSEKAEGMNAAEKRVLDTVANALARLGRVKRVGFGVKDKEGFIMAWSKQYRR